MSDADNPNAPPDEVETAPAEQQARWLAETVGVRRLDLGAIRVTGDDARTWLNGQITNDVSPLSAGETCYALLLTSNGRILTDLHALRLDDGFDLLLPRARLAAVTAHLDEFIIMEDVELEPRSQSVVCAQGPAAADFEGFPADLLGAGGVYVLDEPLERIAALAEAHGGGVVGAAGWELARLRAGRPSLELDFPEKVFPQEAGVAARAVSFTKGCYVGQEVVCMLENRGQLRRRLVQVSAEALSPPGTALLLDSKEVGTVRSGVVDPAEGRATMHAVVKRAQAEAGVELRTESGSSLTVRKILG